MVSGQFGDSDQVVAAHLIPRSTKLDTLFRVGVDDVNSPRNSMMVAKGIEEAYDTLRVTFLRDTLGRFRLTILDPAVRETAIFPSSRFTIGSVEHCQIEQFQVVAPDGSVSLRRPFKRVLSYHAHLAYHNALCQRWITDREMAEPPEVGTPNPNILFQKLFAAAHHEQKGDEENEQE